MRTRDSNELEREEIDDWICEHTDSGIKWHEQRRGVDVFLVIDQQVLASLHFRSKEVKAEEEAIEDEREIAVLGQS